MIIKMERIRILHSNYSSSNLAQSIKEIIKQAWMFKFQEQKRGKKDKKILLRIVFHFTPSCILYTVKILVLNLLIF